MKFQRQKTRYWRGGSPTKCRMGKKQRIQEMKTAKKKGKKKLRFGVEGFNIRKRSNDIATKKRRETRRKD